MIEITLTHNRGYRGWGQVNILALYPVRKRFSFVYWTFADVGSNDDELEDLFCDSDSFYSWDQYFGKFQSR